MPKQTQVLPFAALLLALLTMSVNGGVTFSDGTFNPSDWSQNVLINTGGATQSASQQLSGGNPGAYRQMIHNMSGSSSIGVFHTFLPSAYNPATQGPIATVSYQEDHLVINPPFTGAGVGATSGLLQSGTFYTGPDLTFSDTVWTTVSEPSLTAASFTKISGSGPAMPDFSGSGATIQFGYYRSNTNSAANPITVTSGIDNWSFTVNQVPEPASFSILASLLFALRRRRS